jgi:hypothetical protein
MFQVQLRLWLAELYYVPSHEDSPSPESRLPRSLLAQMLNKGCTPFVQGLQTPCIAVAQNLHKGLHKRHVTQKGCTIYRIKRDRSLAEGQCLTFGIRRVTYLQSDYKRGVERKSEAHLSIGHELSIQWTRVTACDNLYILVLPE